MAGEGWIDREAWDAAAREPTSRVTHLVEHGEPPATCECGRLLQWGFERWHVQVEVLDLNLVPKAGEASVSEYFVARCRCGATHVTPP